MNKKQIKKRKRDLALQNFFVKVQDLMRELVEKHPELDSITKRIKDLNDEPE